MNLDRWDLETDGSDPSDKDTLPNWGISKASLSFVNQDADELQLVLAGDADADSVAAYGTDMILYRDNVIVFLGRVRKDPRSFSGSSEAQTLILQNVWSRLDSTDYLQTWKAHDGSGMVDSESGRYRLGENTDGTYQTTAEIMSVIEAFATDRGIPVTFDLSSLPERRPGLLEGNNQKIGQVVRQIMQSHPESVLVAQYGSSGTVLKAVTNDTAGGILRAVEGSEDVSDLEVDPLYERQVDGVKLIYETTIQNQTVDETVSDLPRVQKASRLVLATDVYPEGLSVTEQTLFRTLPAPSLSLVSAQAPTLQWENVPIETRPLPASGAFDTEADKWWLDHTPVLSSIGITVDDIALPQATTEDLQAHKISLGPAPVETRPSAVNPNAAPLFRPDSIDDLPRELVNGNPSDWMGVKVADVICEVTIIVRKSAVDALDAPSRAKFLRMNPRSGAYLGFASYFLDRSGLIAGTDATTKVYRKVVSVNFDGVSTQAEADVINQAAYEEAVEKAVIPGLAQALYEDFSPLRYRGSFTLKTKDALSQRLLGKVVNLESDTRTEWSSLRGQIQTETVDINFGETKIRFGPPEHLSISDRIGLFEAARIMQDRRAGAANAPSDPTSGTIGPGGSAESDQDNSLNQIGPALGPKHDFQFDSSGESGEITCAGFIISVDESGEISQTPSNLIWTGAQDSGFSLPTYATGTIPASGTYFVFAKLSFSVVSSSVYGSAIQVDNLEFPWSATRPDPIFPEWSGSAWSPTSGIVYLEWSTIVDRVVQSSFGGGLHVVACSPEDVRLVPGCAAAIT